MSAAVQVVRFCWTQTGGTGALLHCTLGHASDSNMKTTTGTRVCSPPVAMLACEHATPEQSVTGARQSRHTRTGDGTSRAHTPHGAGDTMPSVLDIGSQRAKHPWFVVDEDRRRESEGETRERGPPSPTRWEGHRTGSSNPWAARPHSSESPTYRPHVLVIPVRYGSHKRLCPLAWISALFLSVHMAAIALWCTFLQRKS